MASNRIPDLVQKFAELDEALAALKKEAENEGYRRRLLLPYQHHSPAFKKSDLRVIASDQSAFDHVEEEIYKCALDDVRDPSTVPLGILREEVTTKNGHTYSRFHGRPISWMAPFMANPKRVKRIIERADGGPGRVLYERI